MDSTVIVLLNKIADAIGTTVDKLWLILVNQAKVEMYEDLYWGAVMTVICVSSCIWAYKFFKDAKEYKFEIEKEDTVVWCVVLYVVSFITFMFASKYFLNAFSIFNNPEYFALTRILEQLR